MEKHIHHSFQKSIDNPVVRLVQWVSRFWFKAILLYLGLHILFQKNVSIEFGLGGGAEGVQTVEPFSISPTSRQSNVYSAQPTALVNKANTHHSAAPKKSKHKKKGGGRGQTFGNLTPLLSPGYAKRNGIDPAIVDAKIDHCESYVQQFAKVAIAEMETFGIPASITLAQGLLESNAGDSRLATESNNHFGIKCRRKCRGCTCRNYTDDDIYDMFRVFDSDWESYREHSKLLQGARYKHLLKLDKSDYKGWAHGLKKAGYATDKRYAQKLIKIIEGLRLWRFDGEGLLPTP
jgi:flagellum-specific peptidoglycan hydrolase FlgJ